MIAAEGADFEHELHDSDALPRQLPDEVCRVDSPLQKFGEPLPHGNGVPSANAVDIQRIGSGSAAETVRDMLARNRDDILRDTSSARPIAGIGMLIKRLDNSLQIPVRIAGDAVGAVAYLPSITLAGVAVE